MPEKKTTNMLIRAIPMDVWERIDTLCRRRGIKRREFLEQALAVFEGGENREDYNRQEEQAREARLQANQIIDTVQGYKGLIKLKKVIEYVWKNIGIMNDRTTEMNMLVELKKLDKDLNELIRKYVPQHDLPEDPEELRKIGLGDYSYVDIPLDYKRKGFESLYHTLETEFDDSDDALSKDLRELKKKVEEMNKEDHSEKEKPKDDQEADGKTYVFGRGFKETDEDNKNE